MKAKAARKVKRGPVRLWAVVTDGASWGTQSGIVCAFDSVGQARDELFDLREQDENWWIVAGTFTPDKKRAATKPRKRSER